MQCPQCSFENRAGARFCKHCGASLEVLPPAPAAAPTCKHCGAALKPHARFCARCGQPVTAVGAAAIQFSPPPVTLPPDVVSASAAAVVAPAQATPAAGRPLDDLVSAFPRWAWAAFAVLALLCLLFAGLLGIWVLDPFAGTDESSVTPSVTVMATATSTIEIEVSVVPEPEEAVVSPILALDDGLLLSLSSNPVPVGQALTVTVVFTNTGDAFARDVRVYLEQAGTPLLFARDGQTVFALPDELAPQASQTVVFVLDAVAEGRASLLASVSLEWNSDPPVPALRRVGPVEVLVTLEP